MPVHGPCCLAAPPPPPTRPTAALACHCSASQPNSLLPLPPPSPPLPRAPHRHRFRPRPPRPLLHMRACVRGGARGTRARGARTRVAGAAGKFWHSRELCYYSSCGFSPFVSRGQLVGAHETVTHVFQLLRHDQQVGERGAACVKSTWMHAMPKPAAATRPAGARATRRARVRARVRVGERGGPAASQRVLTRGSITHVT